MNNSDIDTQSVLSMRSLGYYSKNTIGAKIAINSTQPLIEKALKEIPKHPILRIADFGSADGGTSQELWFKIINNLKKNDNNKQIEILYTDLPSNDFSTLFKIMQGMEGDSKFSFQNKFSNIFIHGCGTGFHRQLMSNNSLSLGFSATAMHYVSVKPCQIMNHVHMTGANNQEKEKFKSQASKDWESILINRSKELVSGGRFISLNFGIDEKGRYLGNTGGHCMFDKFTFHWKALQKKGIISNDEFISATFTQHYRTVEEFIKPFENSESKVSKSGLKLRSYKTMLTDCPYKIYYEKNKSTMSSLDYAKSLIPTMRSWSETVFKTALNKRDSTEIDKIVDIFYDSYQEEIANNPIGHAMDYIHIVMDIEKV